MQSSCLVSTVLYQAADELLIDVAPSARPNGPHLVQRLDVRTGRVLWSRPPSPYDFLEMVRTTNGFALHYRPWLKVWSKG